MAEFLSPAQVELFALIHGRKNHDGRRTMVREVNLMTLASLVRKQAVLIKGAKHQKYLEPTILGDEAYKVAIHRKYLSWKDELQQARELKI